MKLKSLNCCYQVSLPRSDDHAGELFTLAESLLADVPRGVYDCTRYNVPEVEQSERRGYKGKHEHFSLPVAVLGHEISEFVVIGSGLRMLRS